VKRIRQITGYAACVVLPLFATAVPLLGQRTGSPSYLAEELPTGVMDTPQVREMAQAFARYLCAQGNGALRVVPFRQPQDTNFMPRLPDIAPGVLGSFLVALADRCAGRLTSETSAGSIQLMGFRQSPHAGDSVAVLWQVRSPTVDDEWTVSVHRGWLIRAGRGARVSGVAELRHELYRRIEKDASAVPSDTLQPAPRSER
jgi:hypothetical protein